MRRLQRWVWGLPAQLLVIVTLSLVALLIIVSFGGVSVHNQAMRSLFGARDERATRLAAAMLNERLDNYLILLEMAVAHMADNAPVEHITADTMTLRNLFDYGLVLLDAEGKEIWAWQPSAAWSWRVSDSQPYNLYDLDGLPVVVAHAESQNHAFRLLGAFSLASLNVDVLLSPLRTTDQTAVMLVAADTHTLYQSGDFGPVAAPDDIPGVAPVLRGESGALYVTGKDGQELIVTFSPIPSIDWGLVVHEPWEQVATATLRLSENTPLVLLPIAVLAVLALLFGAWRIVRPLQRLEYRASRLAWGDYDAIREKVGGIAEIDDLQQALVRMARRVQQAERARESYIGAITQGQEEERARLARELHDGTVQSLVALGQRAQMIERQIDDREVATRRLSELRQLIQQALDEVRRMIRDMRPSYLEDLGLVPALKALCADIEAHNTFRVVCHTGTTDARLSSDVEVALFRIAQEALTNISKHARATEVSVSLAISDEETVLKIADNGQGFAVPLRPADLAVDGHFGLMTIAERVRLIGGTFTIESAAAKGTTVEVRARREQAAPAE